MPGAHHFPVTDPWQREKAHQAQMREMASDIRRLQKGLGVDPLALNTGGGAGTPSSGAGGKALFELRSGQKLWVGRYATCDGLAWNDDDGDYTDSLDGVSVYAEEDFSGFALPGNMIRAENRGGVWFAIGGGRTGLSVTASGAVTKGSTASVTVSGVSITYRARCGDIGSGKKVELAFYEHSLDGGGPEFVAVASECS